MTLAATSSQTVGPFSHIGCAYLATERVMPPQSDAADALIRGRVVDGDGVPVPDFMLEIWQPSAGENDRSPSAFARILPADDGSFMFRTAYGTSVTASHLVVLIFMRGLLKPLLTRMYFPDDPRNDADPALALVPPERRATLIACPASTPPSAPERQTSAASLEWSVVLQGAGETVFFEW